jgi:hypothetical protein
LLAISSQSFWIDEAITGNTATQSTLHLAWEELARINGSDLQMPLYMFYVWGWEKIFGGSEWALRMANYPWFLFGQISAAFIWSDRRKGLLFVLVAACNSFIWFYLDEARPYIMEYGAACVVLWFLALLARSASIAEWKFWLFIFGLLSLAAANLLGVLWVATAIGVAGFLIVKKRLRTPIFPLFVCATGLVLLGAYYLWTLTHGARGTHGNPSILNVFFVLYELCGFSGLGPGRLDIRQLGLSSFRPYFLPLAVFALALAIILLRSPKRLAQKEDKQILIVSAIFALPPLFLLFFVGGLIRFSVLGRHAMPAASFILVVLASGIWALYRDKAVFGKVVIVLFLALSFGSSLGIRFLPRHGKDDYRTAAATVSAILPDGQAAWWCASSEGARYYHLATSGIPDRAGRVIVTVANPSEEALASLPVPVVVVLSKADLYDANGTIATMLKEKQFTLQKTSQAFSIWKRPE